LSIASILKKVYKYALTKQEKQSHAHGAAIPQAERAHANIDDVQSVSRKGQARSIMARAAAMDASKGEAAEAREEMTRLQERVRHCDEYVNAERKALVEEGTVWKERVRQLEAEVELVRNRRVEEGRVWQERVGRLEKELVESSQVISLLALLVPKRYKY